MDRTKPGENEQIKDAFDNAVKNASECYRKLEVSKIYLRVDILTDSHGFGALSVFSIRKSRTMDLHPRCFMTRPFRKKKNSLRNGIRGLTS